MIVTKTHKELEDVLLEPKAPGVKEPYYVIRAEEQSITVLNPGNNGVEYNKTYGHINKFQGVEIYQCLYGQGLVLMQRNDENGDAKEFKVASISFGKIVQIPVGFGHLLVNTGKTFLVVADNSPNRPDAHDYQSVKVKRGLAYYVVEKKGEIAFEENPNYHIHPQISSE